MQSGHDQEPFDFICAKKFGYLGLYERKSSEGKGKIGKKKKKEEEEKAGRQEDYKGPLVSSKLSALIE